MNTGGGGHLLPRSTLAASAGVSGNSVGGRSAMRAGASYTGGETYRSILRK